MQKLTKIFFSIADVAAYLQIFATIILLLRSLGQLLTMSFSVTAASSSSNLLLIGWLWFLAALVAGALGMLGAYLHLKRQVLGLFLIAFVLVVGLLPPYGSLKFFAIAAFVQFTVYALPWTLMYVDLRRRGLTRPV